MPDLEDIDTTRRRTIKDKKLKLFGIRVSGASIMGLFALLSTMYWLALYGGFSSCIKRLNHLPALDLRGYKQLQMKKTSAAVIRIEEHADSIKIELKERYD